MTSSRVSSIIPPWTEFNSDTSFIVLIYRSSNVILDILSTTCLKKDINLDVKKRRYVLFLKGSIRKKIAYGFTNKHILSPKEAQTALHSKWTRQYIEFPYQIRICRYWGSLFNKSLTSPRDQTVQLSLPIFAFSLVRQSLLWKKKDSKKKKTEDEA